MASPFQFFHPAREPARINPFAPAIQNYSSSHGVQPPAQNENHRHPRPGHGIRRDDRPAYGRRSDARGVRFIFQPIFF